MAGVDEDHRFVAIAWRGGRLRPRISGEQKPDKGGVEEEVESHRILYRNSARPRVKFIARKFFLFDGWCENCSLDGRRPPLDACRIVSQEIPWICLFLLRDKSVIGSLKDIGCVDAFFV